MTPQEQLEAILHYTKTNIKSFSEMVGYDRPQVLYDLAHGKTRSFSQNMILKITAAFPEISKEWLRTGNGAMYTDGRPVQPDLTSAAWNEDTTKLFLQMSETIRSQQETITHLLSRIKELESPKTEMTNHQQ